MHAAPGVVHVQHLVEVVSVVLAGCARGDATDEAMLEVHAHAQLVAEVALAVLLRVRGIHILLPALGLAPSGRSTFGQGLALLPVQALARRGHQRSIDGLSAPGHVAMAVQLRIHSLEQHRGPIHAQPLAEAPDRVAVRHVHRILQQAKALVARPIQQLVLHLFIGQVVQPLQDQDAHHHLGGIGRPATPAAIATLDQGIHQPGQGSEVDVPRDHLQRITHLVPLVLARGLGEQIELQGAAGCDHGKGRVRLLVSGRERMGFEKFPGDCTHGPRWTPRHEAADHRHRARRAQGAVACTQGA